jgi:CheY-like chemotaxis protein
VTGYSHDEYRRRARDAGFDRQLTKPLDLKELERILAG